ncbi:MAG: DUF3754 domain-containing protein [Alphaproteobacteria bacterium]|nr:DUF3754 domain-containing protein [Alphaproteobacteria bacterium]
MTVASAHDGYIPARKGELIAALARAGGLDDADAARFPAVAQLLAAILHHESHEHLEALKALYDPLEPEAPAMRHVTGEDAFRAFETAFADALAKANFTELAQGVADVGRTQLYADLKLKTSDLGIRSVRYFVRGAHTETVAVRRLFVFSKTVTAPFVDDVVVLVAFKDEDEITKRTRRRVFKMRRGVRPGAVLLKRFRNVAEEELISLHPGATPAMPRRDQVILAAPAIAGGLPVALQLWPALSVLFAVIAIYFGAQGAVSQSELHKAVAALSGLIAVGAFVMRQKLKYERQTLLYQKRLSDTVYFRNLANNSGVIDSLVNAGEEQDTKEALLAYWALRRAQTPLTKAEIDKAAEDVLASIAARTIDFEISDALAKLERLGLVSRNGDAYSALPCVEALKTLDAVWDGFFSYAHPQAAE